MIAQIILQLLCGRLVSELLLTIIPIVVVSIIRIVVFQRRVLSPQRGSIRMNLVVVVSITVVEVIWSVSFGIHMRVNLVVYRVRLPLLLIVSAIRVSFVVRILLLLLLLQLLFVMHAFVICYLVLYLGLDMSVLWPRMIDITIRTPVVADIGSLWSESLSRCLLLTSSVLLGRLMSLMMQVLLRSFLGRTVAQHHSTRRPSHHSSSVLVIVSSLLLSLM